MNGIKADPDIKMDPDAVTPSHSGYMDDEFYEDTGELALPKDEVRKDAWLTRIPDWLYEAVAQWDGPTDGNENDQIVIGELVAFATTSGIDKSRPMRLFLDDKWEAKSNLPSAFQVDPAPISDTLLGNTYVFTENNLPGYKRENDSSQFSRGGAQGSFGAVQDPRARVQKRSKYKKAIPKQTTLIGHATRQYNANPLETKEYKDFSAKRIKQAVAGSNSTTILANDIEVTDFKTAKKLENTFADFVTRTQKTKPQQNKASRMPRNDLIDILHGCFDEFQYWPMKALKIRTKQPEQYLKDVLGDIADLVKSGSFASTWQRRSIFDKDRDISKQVDAVPELAEGESEGEQDMEDVV